MEKYYDINGKEVSLEYLVRNEPDWAANRIRYYRNMNIVGIWQTGEPEHNGTYLVCFANRKNALPYFAMRCYSLSFKAWSGTQTPDYWAKINLPKEERL